MLARTPSAKELATAKASRILVSYPASMKETIAMTMMASGAMQQMIKVSFQLVMNAMINAAIKAETPWNVSPSFSEMPF